MRWINRRVRSESEGRRRRGADDLGFVLTDIAEAMGQAAVEIIGVAGAEHAALGADGDLDLAAQDDAALLGFVAQQGGAGVGAGGVALMQDLQGAVGEVAADLAEGEAAGAAVAGHFDQVGGLIEDASARRFLRREELGHLHRDAVEHLLQRADGRAGAVLLDQRDGGVGDAGALGQLALAEPVYLPQPAQPAADIDVHANESAAVNTVRYIERLSRPVQHSGIDLGRTGFLLVRFLEHP